MRCRYTIVSYGLVADDDDRHAPTRRIVRRYPPGVRPPWLKLRPNESVLWTLSDGSEDSMEHNAG